MKATNAIEKKFLEVYEENMDAIFRHCYLRVFHRERAKEIMQEAFARTWEEVARGRDIANIRAFVYRVANNLIIDESRRKKAVSLDSLMEEGFSPGDQFAVSAKDHIDGAYLYTLVKKLDPLYRDAVLMRYHDNLTPKEIAEITGESVNVISVRIYRGVRMLRALIDTTTV